MTISATEGVYSSGSPPGFIHGEVQITAEESLGRNSPVIFPIPYFSRV